MDLSTLISPLVSLVSAIKSYSATNSNKGNFPTLATIDRALGTAASLGIAIGLYRLMYVVLKKLRDEYKSNDSTNNSSDDARDILLSMKSIVQVLLRGILMGLGMKRIKSEVQNETKKDDDAQIRTFNGSCHCKSVLFYLRTSSHVEPIKCNGKISYPHCKSNADDFQLITGTKFLSVYYVDLCDSTKHYADRHVTAAYTFCKRCGVHILRAPNSMSSKLEVNTNCLDDFNKNKSQRDSFIPFNVTAPEKSIRKNIARSESNGDIRNTQDEPPSCENHTIDDSFHPITARANYVGAQPFYDVETVYEEDYKKWKEPEYGSQASTPAATLTLSGSCLSSSESSTSDSYSCDGNVDYRISPNCVDRNDDSTNKSAWSTSSSVRSSVPKNHHVITPPTGPISGKMKSRPTSSMNDQLKYYMKKHMRTPSAPQERI